MITNVYPCQFNGTNLRSIFVQSNNTPWPSLPCAIAYISMMPTFTPTKWYSTCIAIFASSVRSIGVKPNSESNIYPVKSSIQAEEDNPAPAGKLPLK